MPRRGKISHKSKKGRLPKISSKNVERSSAKTPAPFSAADLRTVLKTQNSKVVLFDDHPPFVHNAEMQVHYFTTNNGKTYRSIVKINKSSKASTIIQEDELKGSDIERLLKDDLKTFKVQARMVGKPIDTSKDKNLLAELEEERKRKKRHPVGKLKPAMNPSNSKLYVNAYRVGKRRKYVDEKGDEYIMMHGTWYKFPEEVEY